MKIEYLKLFLRDIEGIRNPSLVEQLEKQIEKFKSAKRLSEAGQITKLGPNAFRIGVRDMVSYFS